MTPSVTECIPEQFNFGRVKGRNITANFQGGTLTSDGGLVLIAELDKKREITTRFASCFTDHRHQSYVAHSVTDLVAQRVYGIIQGYEDLNDHEKLRNDSVFAIALGKVAANESESVLLAGKSTLNRLEYCPETVIEQATSRYHRISHSPKQIERLLVELFLESYRKAPRQIVLDLDVTDDQVHGKQEMAFFNTYYNGVCYAPLYIFCGKHLLAAKLRPSNVDPASEGLEELQRVIELIRSQWSQTQILVRGDSAYSREEIMSWCEAQKGVDYVFGLATNNQLRMRASDIIAKAKADYEQRLTPVSSLMEEFFSPDEDLKVARELVKEALWYRSLSYKTQSSWSRARRVVTKVVYGNQGLKMRFVVTSLNASKIPLAKLYTEKYCPRGEMENRIKEQQLELFSDRTSTHTFEGNQLRLWFSALAYVLMQEFRQQCLVKTSLENATVGTIRTLLLKLGARVRVSVRRVLISISSSCPYQDIFSIAYERITMLPASG